MAEEKHIGLFGGTFNPIHWGHLRAAEDCAAKLRLEKIIFIPSFLPPHKGLDADVPASRRLEMIRLAIKENALLNVSDAEIIRRGESYTYDTLRALQRVHPDARFHFILGVDAYREIGSWYRFRDILDLADWIVVTRPGYPLKNLFEPLLSEASRFQAESECALVSVDAKTRISFVEVRATDVSSSAVRDAIRNGKAIDKMVPPAVAGYIVRNRLYR
jgi:nicotinate-nucleotide adenylyltransferase